MKKVKQIVYTEMLRTYVGTPFIHGGRIKGPQGGVDCVGMLIAAASDLGIKIEVPYHYAPGDRIAGMLDHLEKHCQRIEKFDADNLNPGDLILIRHRWIYQHLLYVTAPNTVIHAWVSTGVNRVTECPLMDDWKKCIHSVWRFKFLKD